MLKESQRFLVLLVTGREITLTLQSSVAERTMGTNQGHMVETSPLSIVRISVSFSSCSIHQVADDHEVSLVSFASNAVVDLTEREHGQKRVAAQSEKEMMGTMKFAINVRSPLSPTLLIPSP